MADSRTLGLTALFANGDKSSIPGLDEALHGRKQPIQIIDPIHERVRYSNCITLYPGEKLPPGRARC